MADMQDIDAENGKRSCLNAAETPQQLWDLLLVDGWRGDWPIAKVCAYWFRSQEIENTVDTIDCLAKIKRAPREPWELRMPVRAFVANVLPITSRWLWAGARGDRIMKILQGEQRIKIKRSSQKYESTKAKDAPPKELRGRYRYFDMHGGFRRSDWHKVK